MKKESVNKQINKIFQIIGEELNLSNDFTYDDYLKLDYDTKKMFDDVLDYKFKEKRGIFRTDFQKNVDKLNNTLRENGGKDKTITTLHDMYSIIENKNSMINNQDNNIVDNAVVNDKLPIRKRIVKYWNSIPEGLRNASLISLGVFVATQTLYKWSSWTISTGALTAAGVSGVGTLVIPSILALYCGYKGIKKYVQKKNLEKTIQKSRVEAIDNYSFNKSIVEKSKNKNTEVIYPDSFGINKNEQSETFVPEVPVFKNPKEKELKVIYPDSFGINKNEKSETFVPEVPVFRNPKEKDLEEEETTYPDSFDEELEDDILTIDDIKTTDKKEDLSETVLKSDEFVDTEFVDKEEEIIENNEETKVSKEYKPKHLKRDDKPSKDEKKQKIEEDIKSCERMIEILSYKTILNETEEQKEYVREKIKKYKTKLRRLKEQHKKFEIQSYDVQFNERRKKLVSKLNKLEKNDANKQIISNIEIAISQIDSYMKYSDAYKNGFISEEELNNKGNNTYMIVDYVMNERQKRTRK